MEAALHVAVAAAKAKAIPAPGQPRKTPNAKRVAQVLEDDEDEAEPILTRPGEQYVGGVAVNETLAVE